MRPANPSGCTARETHGGLGGNGLSQAELGKVETWHHIVGPAGEGRWPSAHSRRAQLRGRRAMTARSACAHLAVARCRHHGALSHGLSELARPTTFRVVTHLDRLPVEPG